MHWAEPLFEQTKLMPCALHACARVFYQMSTEPSQGTYEGRDSSRPYDNGLDVYDA